MALSFETSFLKAMQLLHSPAPDASEQLKTILDECIAQKKAPQVLQPVKQQPPLIKPVVANRQAQSATTSTTSTVNPVTQPLQVPQPIIVPTDDIDLTGMGCVVCKRVDQRTGNEIVECQECHGLYHQECHKPSLANENVKDPRFVWYCSTCTSKRKKIKLPAKAPASLTNNVTTNKDTKEAQNPELSPFKSWSFVKK